MNSQEIIEIMKSLRSGEEPCPYCHREKNRHDRDCVFADIHVSEVLLEAHLSPSISSQEIKPIFYDFVRERSGREFYLDAIGFFLTTDFIYKDLGIAEEDMIFLVENIPRFPFLWRILVHRVVVRKPFFRRVDDNSKDTAQKVLEAIEILMDLKGSDIGDYPDSDTQKTQTQREVLVALRDYITRWMRQRRLS